MTVDRGPTPARLRLPSKGRLHSSREFQRVYQKGSRASGGLLTVVCLRRNDAGLPRLGLSVSKDHGSAVRRNKIKRLLREAFRHERHGLPRGIDVVLIPRPQEAHASFVDYRAEVVRLVEKALSQPRRAPRRRKPQ